MVNNLWNNFYRVIAMTYVCRMTYNLLVFGRESEMQVNNVLVRLLNEGLSVTYWFADCFGPKFWNFFSCRVKNISCRVRVNPHKVRLSRMSDG